MEEQQVATAVADEMHQVLAELEMLPHGTVTNWSPSGHGVPDSRPPSGVRLDGPSELPPHLLWRMRWEQADEHEQATILEKAKAELDAWRKGHGDASAGETTAETEKRMLREGKGWPAKDVALRFNCTPTYVERVRRAAGRTADLGEGAAGGKDGDEAERARELLSRGFSEKQIRMILRCGGSKLDRLLGRTSGSNGQVRTQLRGVSKQSTVGTAAA
jgi:hypothetical protein